MYNAAWGWANGMSSPTIHPYNENYFANNKLLAKGAQNDIFV
jgi:hypothetical protein